MVFDRVEFLDDRVIITNNRLLPHMILFKTWYTNRSIVDLYEFNQCCFKRSFMEIKFGRKIDKDDDDIEVLRQL